MSYNNKAKLLRKKKQNMYFIFITIDDSLMNLNLKLISHLYKILFHPFEQTLTLSS